MPLEPLEKERDRLLSLWQECEADEADSEKEDEIDHVSCNSDYSNQDQEAEVEEEGQMREQLQEMEENEEEVRENNFFVNIIIHSPGVKASARNAKTPIEFFQNFMNELMITDIVMNTNNRIAEKSEKWKNSPHYVETTVVTNSSYEVMLVLPDQ
ncbi:hypothetical protein MML48_3g00018588 [Holotrichia oblita]|uniref:Uncharacterized protein n=1 Tax=Holotrichia oblita TaxID=644536 RepID=A0ACB9TH20_HOLOL|nr:hypothetical protein MML48_3g00018588 [Holotrichia oblita]